MANGGDDLAVTYRTLIANAGRNLELATAVITVSGRRLRSEAAARRIAGALGELADLVANSAGSDDGKAGQSGASGQSSLPSALLDSKISVVRAALEAAEAEERKLAKRAIGNAADVMSAAGRQRQADLAFLEQLGTIVADLKAKLRQRPPFLPQKDETPATPPTDREQSSPHERERPVLPETGGDVGAAALQRFQDWAEAFTGRKLG